MKMSDTGSDQMGDDGNVGETPQWRQDLSNIPIKVVHRPFDDSALDKARELFELQHEMDYHEMCDVIASLLAALVAERALADDLGKALTNVRERNRYGMGNYQFWGETDLALAAWRVARA